MAQNAGSLVKKNPRRPVQQQEDVSKMESGVGQNWPVQVLEQQTFGMKMKKSQTLFLRFGFLIDG